MVPGDRVALVGTAGPPPQERLAAAEALLTDWGLQPVRLPSVLARHARADYLSGEDAERAADFHQAWEDPSLSGIVVVRGGYGTVRMLDDLDVHRLRASGPKPVYGSSDVTALHELLREQVGVPSWFTPMPATADLLDDPVAVQHLRRAMLEPWTERVHRGGGALAEGTASGTLIGGNLSLLAMTLGARSRPPVDNTDALVVLEDVNEETYRIDGYLTSLLRAGWFEGVAGVLVGSWKGCALAEVHALIAELLGELGVPIGTGFELGHGPGAESLPLGVPARLEASAEARLVIPALGETLKPA
ncbi:LD-carboxypeptidase [Naumannella sp. ID2617S]|nr:LD-carboxypeptidase [Naumannella sp. ID2617S]